MNFTTGANRYSHWWLDRCFLYVGRMARNKGVLQILDAWLELADQLGPACPPLWLVGGEPDEIETIRSSTNVNTLSAHEVEGRVKWWGYLDSHGISTLLLKTYVLVTHSKYEPGGRVVLEALTQGIPVIASGHGFAADLIKDWHNGFLVDFGDIDGLRKRMEHFALQPLLRHAMGRKAQQTVSLAMKQWDFVNSHLSAYKSATAPDRTEESGIQAETVPDHDFSPIPRGFDGVYPFESTTLGRSHAIRFFSGHTHHSARDLEINEIEGRARSRIWTVFSSEGGWVIKHAFSTYRLRPIWDRGFNGSAVDTQDVRVRNEILAASFCNRAAPLVAVDFATGLTLREWLEPLTPCNGALLEYVSSLAEFHASRTPSVDLHAIQSIFDQDWYRICDELFFAKIAVLEESLKHQALACDVWQPMSLQLVWRWLKLGLSKNWLSIPMSLKNDVDQSIDAESKSVASEERRVNFGFCHGDSDLAHFRINAEGKTLLIDCEKFHPGYFGHDLAGIVRHFLVGLSDREITGLVEQVFSVLRPEICSPVLLLSWLKWINIMQICKSHALMRSDMLERELLFWQLQQRLSTLFRSVTQ